MIDFDVLLQKLGSFGTYQIIVFTSLLYYQVPAGMMSIAPVFISYTPEHRCLMPFDDPAYPNNLTYKDKMNLTTPLDEYGEPIDGCTRYGYNITQCEVSGDLSCVDTSQEIIQCDQYYFNPVPFTATTVTEFELICGRSTLNALGSSFYMVGLLLGALVFGYFVDRVGRKVSIAVTGMGMLVCRLGTAYSSSLTVFFFWRCFGAFFNSGCDIGIFSHLMEIVGSEWRTFVGIGYQAGFALGYMLWSGVAYFYRDWQQMQLGSLVLSLPLAIIVLLVPESPRWLFVKGKEKKGKQIVHIMERYNNVKIDESVWEECKTPTSGKHVKSESTYKYSTFDLFRYRGITKVTLAMGFNWFVNTMVYYGVSLSAGNLAGDIIINNIYVGVFEFTSCICIIIMDRVGRRLLLTATMNGAGLSLIAATIVNEYAGNNATLITLGLAFAFIGKAFASGSYAIVYNFTGELYPTVVRGNGIAFASVLGGIGSIISPFIIQLSDQVSWLPNTVFGSLAVIAGLLVLGFRDTTGRPMMETIEEAEMFYTGKDIPLRKKDKYNYEAGALTRSQ